MKHNARCYLVALLCFTGWSADTTFAAPAIEPDAYRIETGARFQPLAPENTDRPDWLFATARGTAQSVDGTRDWVIYECALDRNIPFHHLLMELLIDEELSALFVRLLDDERRTVSADLFGNVAGRVDGPGNVFLDLPLAEQPTASIVQVLLPLEEDAHLRLMSVIPASYEILMKSAGDFASGARTWIRTPVYDPKNLDLLTDLVLLEDGQRGDMTSPISAFAAYGVDARALDAFAFLPDAGDGYHYAGTGFALDAMPALARFHVTVRHFDPLRPIDVWLNGEPVGALSLDLPDLEDPAYWPNRLHDGWRVGRWTRAWFFVDHDLLTLGDNTLVISQRIGHPDAPALEMYGPTLQFKYPWEEIATFHMLQIRDPESHSRPVAGINDAPLATAQQEDDTFIIRADHAFQPIDHTSDKPDWLDSVTRETHDRHPHFTIRLNPDNRPHQLGLDVIYMRGRHTPVQVALLKGDTLIEDDLFGPLKLDSLYVQSTLPLHIPLAAHEADGIQLRLLPRYDNAHAPRLSRLQLKAVWPSAVLAKGHFGSDGSLATLHYDARSAHISGEAIVPVPRTESGQAPASERITHRPLQTEGEWYGAETRLLDAQRIRMGDVHDTYFAEWTVDIVADTPQLGRIDLLVEHVNVVESLAVKVNGIHAGTMSLHLPGLQDANYMLFRVNRINEAGTDLTPAHRYAIDYGPYARASLVFDGRLLQPGANTIAIGKAPRLKGTNDHYSMENIRLQLKYAWDKDVP